MVDLRDGDAFRVAAETVIATFGEVHAPIHLVGGKTRIESGAADLDFIQVRAIDVGKQGNGNAPDEIVAAMLYLFSEDASKINGARILPY